MKKITQFALSSLAATAVISINQAAGETEPGGEITLRYSVQYTW